MIHDEIYRIQKKGPVTVVCILEEKLYQDAVVPFQEGMIQLLEADEKLIVVDLSLVEVMNSSGIGVLILLWDRMSEIDGHLILTGMRPFLLELFQRMRLDLIFHIAENEEEAIRLMEERK